MTWPRMWLLPDAEQDLTGARVRSLRVCVLAGTPDEYDVLRADGWLAVC
ncbi:hypothetical protein ACGFIF_37895 [Kribbella sp. NPDC049174]